MTKRFKINKYNDLMDKAKAMGDQLKKADTRKKKAETKLAKKQQDGMYS